jgi:molybdopterin/thiamine biosynthesis adenylyltransferase/rhodanese-related sulfurtransferase
MSTLAFRDGVEDIDVHTAWRRVQDGARLVDVREPSEWSQGRPARSESAPCSALEAALADLALSPGQDIVLICAGGVRSRRVAEHLAAAGHARVASVTGGFGQWLAAGLPLLEGEGLPPADAERYDRHLRLPDVGLAGQKRLLSAKVLLVGAGGLGSPAALYLAAAGIGQLTLVDDDHVERSNLQRQVLHGDSDVGQAKVLSAAKRLAALNPGVHVEPVGQRLDRENVLSLLAGHDLVIDGADNFDTRYLVNAACGTLGIPWVYGAVERFRGQVSLFVPGAGPCYRCLFPEPPPPGFAPNCAEAGVLGVLPGVIGLLQATEAIKHLLGLGQTLAGTLLTYDAASMRFGRVTLERDPACPGCAEGAPMLSRLPATGGGACSA